MANTMGRCVVVLAVITACGCSQEIRSDSSAMSSLASRLPTSPSMAPEADALAGQPRAGVFGGVGTVKETLTGPAINGVVPEGRALADMSQFESGGSTILTVQIKNVNLPDGTALGVTLDFTPVGSITLSRGEGTLRVSLGHFGVSNDQVRVNNSGTTMLVGAFFQ